MSFVKNLLCLLIAVITFVILKNCQTTDKETAMLSTFTAYYKATKAEDGTKWNHTSDTVRVWFEKTDNSPSLKYRDKKPSPWAEWDRVMNAESYYDTIWYNEDLRAVQGYFYERNDFYTLIGASPNKTLCTYFFDETGKINGLLYQRIEGENTISAKHMDPIYDWAIKNDSAEIVALYPDKEFVPSAENALRWKKLLKRYHADNRGDAN